MCPLRTVLRTCRPFSTAWPVLGGAGRYGTPTGSRPGHPTPSARVDPFADVWPQIEAWLEQQPEATAKELFARLQREQPEQFPGSQFQTLRRRVKEYRTAIGGGSYTVPPPRGNRPQRARRRRPCPGRSIPAHVSIAEPSSPFRVHSRRPLPGRPGPLWAVRWNAPPRRKSPRRRPPQLAAAVGDN